MRSFTGRFCFIIGGEEDPMENSPGSVSAWTEENVLSYGSPQTIARYQNLKNYILDLDSHMRIGFKKLYAHFDYQGKRIACVELQINAVIVWLNVNPNLLHDPYHMVRDVTNVGHHGVGNSQLKIDNASQEDKAKQLIAQAFGILCGVTI